MSLSSFTSACSRVKRIPKTQILLKWLSEDRVEYMSITVT